MAASSRQMDSGAPLTRRFVAFGCIFEEDFPANLVACQAWSGCLSIRVANLKTWRGVVGTVNSDVTDLTCFTSVQETDGTYTIQTVSFTADTRLQQRRVRHLSSSHPSRTTSLLLLHPVSKSSSPSASRLARALGTLVSISSIHPTTRNTPEYTFTLHQSLVV